MGNRPPTDTTTASTLAFTLWELAKSPVTQRRVRDEILAAKRVVSKNTGIDEIPFSYYEKMPLLIALTKVSRNVTHGDKYQLTV
jgi:cytochrome P450